MAIALAEITDDPQDRAFVLLECLNLLLRDGQFARVKLLAERLQGVTQTAAEGPPVPADEPLGHRVEHRRQPRSRCQRPSPRARPERPREERQHSGIARLDLAVAAAIRAAFVDGEVSFADRTRDLAIRFDDGLSVSLLDSAPA